MASLPPHPVMGFAIVVIGASRGGVNALQVLLAGLPATFPLPVAVVLHRRAEAGDLHGEVLGRAGPLPVREAEDKEKIRPGHVTLAPADYHLMIDGDVFALSTEGPVCRARPSIEVLFESAAEAYGAGVIGVVLTGASADGALGARTIEERGGRVVVQAPDSAASPAMPEASLAAARRAMALPLEEIAPFLISLTHGSAESSER